MATAKAAKIAPENGRVGIGFNEMIDLKNLIEALNVVDRGDLYIESGKIKISSTNDYPVGWLLQAENDGEWLFIPWDDQHDS